MSFARRLGFFAACLAMWACAPRTSPQASYDQIAKQIAHGDYNTALSQVNLASARFAADSPQWDWSFRIQKAQILIARSAPKEALDVLNGPLPSSLASTELPALKALFEGSAHMNLQQLDKSQAELSEAEHLATASHPRLLSQVANTQATLSAYRGNYAEAERGYEQGLKLAGEYGREDQKVVAEVGLAWVATHQGHFDQGAERGQAALQLARALGMQNHVATTLGNLAWNYQELGDPNLKGRVRIWDVANGRLIATGSTVQPGFASVKFRPDGRKIVAGGCVVKSRLNEAGARERRDLPTGSTLAASLSSSGRRPRLIPRSFSCESSEHPLGGGHHAEDPPDFILAREWELIVTGALCWGLAHI